MMKTEEQLFEQAQRLRSEAQSLLFKAGLLAVTQQFGPTLISGSFTLDLMTWRDLDIYVRLESDLDIPTFFAVGAAITAQFRVLKASYSNHFIRKLPGFDHGLYWGIRLDYRGQTWKLDLWGYGPARFDEHKTSFERWHDALKSADRGAILRIKDILSREEGYRHNVSSIDIYTAVLTADVRTVEEFRQWHRQAAPRRAT